ncbi:MAG: hypothetical protein Q9169_007679 [Polycauliona sp. 2 TL-2023]
MTWQDGEKNFFATYLSSIRMGPIGYILGSPYSPLRVEQEVPSRNWRDAFEDLLSLDAGGNMISEAHRRAEDVSSAKQLYQLASENITMYNKLIRENEKVDGRLAKLCKVAITHGDKEGAAFYEGTSRSQTKEVLNNLAIRAQAVKSDYETSQGKSASRLRSHGQWIASLVSSGALPGWYWDEKISVDGPLMEYGRVDAPPELEASITFTEKELSAQFNDGQPNEIGLPLMLSSERLKALSEGELQAPRARIGPWTSFHPGPSSILMQTGVSKTFKRSDGSTGTTVIIKNEQVDGKWVEREYTEEPGKLLEETVNARRSMASLWSFLVGEGPQEDHLDQIDSLNKRIDEEFAMYEDNISL